MCGIVGYVGDSEAAPIILAGLGLLEYRGYDSAGLATVSDEGVQVRKRAGKVAALASLIEEQPAFGTTGIGHTRWATRGGVTDRNAHPHLDASGRLALVHNGETENVEELRLELLAAGHTFASETDSEVIAHLVGVERERGHPLEEALRRTLVRLRGGHAAVVLDLTDPSALVVGRAGNAGGLVVGQSDDGVFIASDLPAVVRYTRRVWFVEVGEVATVRRDAICIRTMSGDPVEREHTVVPWVGEVASRAGYAHFMLKEIAEQPEALARAVAPRVRPDSTAITFASFELPMKPSAIDRVVLVGSGTTRYAGMIGAEYLEQLAGVAATAEIASEFQHEDAPLWRRTLVVAISQSGETADVIHAVVRAQALGARVVGLVNAEGSELTRRADAVVYMHAGPEISVASTKVFTSEVVNLYLLACKPGTERGGITPSAFIGLRDAITDAPQLVADALRSDAQVKAIAQKYYQFAALTYIGRGLSYPIALEGALKLKEIAYKYAEGYAAGELKHGPLALIDSDTPTIAVVPQDGGRAKVRNQVAQIRARGGRVIAIATEGDEEVDAAADDVVFVPSTPALLSPLVTVIPLQLFAYHVANELGYDIDQPRNLAKSVTVE